MPIILHEHGGIHSRGQEARQKRRIRVREARQRGKGSHGELYYRDRKTSVTYHGSRHEIPSGLLTKMLKDLGLLRKDIGQ